MKPSDVKRTLHSMLAWREACLKLDDDPRDHFEDEADALEAVLEQLGILDENMLDRMREKAEAKVSAKPRRIVRLRLVRP